jgi:hypothetical protein
MQAADGSLYKKDFLFEVNGKPVLGWVGILKQGAGGRVEAGFSVIQAKRVIHGWPEAWRPMAIYGPYGTNDLVNQRLVGELELDGFEVSHSNGAVTKRSRLRKSLRNTLAITAPSRPSGAARAISAVQPRPTSKLPSPNSNENSNPPNWLTR